MVKINKEYFYEIPKLGERVFLMPIGKIFPERIIREILKELRTEISNEFILDMIELGTIIEVATDFKIFLK